MFFALPQQTDSFEDDRRFRVGPTAEKLATRMGNHSAAGISRKRTCFIDFGRSACRSEEHTSELQSHLNLVCRLLLEKKKQGRTAQELARSTGARGRHARSPCRSTAVATGATSAERRSGRTDPDTDIPTRSTLCCTTR